MAQIEKGIVSSINGDTAIVMLENAREVVTSSLVIPWALRGENSLAVGVEVLFVQFADGTGNIIARADGLNSSGVVEG